MTRLFGVIASIWVVWLLEHPATPVRHLFMVAWVVACAFLVLGRGTATASFVLAMLAVVGIVLGEQAAGPSLVFWIGLILAATRANAHERALLLRVCCTCVYAYAVLAKLNPAWLSGDQMVYLARTRPLVEPLQGLIRPAATWVAVGVLVLEATVPAALWWPATRRAGAILGVVLHVALILAATRSVGSLAELAVVNGLLVLTYAGFFVREEGVEGGPRLELASA